MGYALGLTRSRNKRLTWAFVGPFRSSLNDPEFWDVSWSNLFTGISRKFNSRCYNRILYIDIRREFYFILFIIF